MSHQHYNSNIIIACDFSSKKELKSFLKKFKKEKLFLKVGYEILYSEGLSIVKWLKSLKHNVFVDLKLHDIPQTMIKGIKNLNKYKFDFLTIHCGVGNSALSELKNANITNNLLGVTVLTSIDKFDLAKTYLIDSKKVSLQQNVLNLANMANEYGLIGVICSAHESKLIKEHYPKLITVCPGISLETNAYDQKRTANIKDIKKYDADFLVVGRAITNAANPYKIYLEIKEKFNDAKN